MVQLYEWQPVGEQMEVLTDSDWATCRLTRRSCSGGVIRRGTHILGHWSKVQGKIAPSSGEAELFAANVGLSQFAGVINLQRELHSESFGEGKLSHCTDASACRGILLRRGAGAIKHLEVRDLWGQEMVRRYNLEVRKLPRALNPSDLLASASDAKSFEEHLTQLGVWFEMDF